jgi:hypothetical protein
MPGEPAFPGPVARMSLRASGYTCRNDRQDARSRHRGRERRSMVDIFVELVKAVVTLGVFVAIVLIMAGLFIIVLSLATGIDSHIQPDEDRR